MDFFREVAEMADAIEGKRRCLLLPNSCCTSPNSRWRSKARAQHRRTIPAHDVFEARVAAVLARPGTAPTRSGRSAWPEAGGVRWSTASCRAFGARALRRLDRGAADLGQANPTLTAVQLGLRLADDIAGAGVGASRNRQEGSAMRRVTLGTTGIETSCLGFGCASLGSRVGAAPGLRALAAAHDAGVAWFDLAPLYGAGRAEEIAGRFLGAAPATASSCQQGRPRPRRRPMASRRR